jgi:DNA modification methylase
MSDTMLVKMWPLARLKPYPGNPRINDAAVDAVANSIKEFGWRVPIVVDEEGVILAGHTRLKAALKLKLSEVPVHVARGLTPEQARAFRIADNQTSAIAEWDEDRLIAELLALQATDYDLSLTGFEDDELTRMLAQTQEFQADPDDVPEPPDEAITLPGDLWLMGNHRLLCGDATKPDNIARLMNGVQTDLLLTDPPYGVAYVGRTADALTIANDDLDEPALRHLFVGALNAAKPHLKPGAAFYLWHADSAGFTFRAACEDAGFRVRQCLVWVKSCFSLGRQDYQWKHEPCLYGWADDATHTWLGNRSQTTVLEFDKPSRNAEHPTMKPVELFAYLLGNSCKPGGVVLDPFAGSGTTVLACEMRGCHAYVSELDPKYCDVIVKRWSQVTGKKAERAPCI